MLAVDPFVHISVAPGKEFTWKMTYAYAAVAAQPAKLPAGPGKAAFETICSGCHDTAQATDRKRTRADWERLVDDMVTRGATGTDAEFEAITDYLAKNFGKN